jgi:hypothetical protein
MTEVLDRVLDTARERPKRAALSVLLILFWIAAPLASQLYLDLSAITVSFSITLVYFLAWKAYKRLH